jgi:hypothetical protein
MIFCRSLARLRRQIVNDCGKARGNLNLLHSRHQARPSALIGRSSLSARQNHARLRLCVPVVPCGRCRSSKNQLRHSQRRVYARVTGKHVKVVLGLQWSRDPYGQLGASLLAPSLRPKTDLQADVASRMNRLHRQIRSMMWMTLIACLLPVIRNALAVAQLLKINHSPRGSVNSRLRMTMSPLPSRLLARTP